MRTRARHLAPPEGSFFLFGPRGTGKSIWLRSVLPEARRFDLLDERTFYELSSRPGTLEERIRAGDPRRTVVIDEVQRLPELLNVVHRLIESKEGWRFALTGSSARKLRRGGVNLLAGRASVWSMHPFMASELGDLFELDRALHLGMLPVVLGARDPERAQSSYVGT